MERTNKRWPARLHQRRLTISPFPAMRAESHKIVDILWPHPPRACNLCINVRLVRFLASPAIINAYNDRSFVQFFRARRDPARGMLRE